MQTQITSVKNNLNPYFQKINFEALLPVVIRKQTKNTHVNIFTSL